MTDLTEKEKEALKWVKKKQPKSAAKLAKLMECTRQRADFLLQSLRDKDKIEYVPAKWKVVTKKGPRIR